MVDFYFIFMERIDNLALHDLYCNESFSFKILGSSFNLVKMDCNVFYAVAWNIYKCGEGVENSLKSA